jgi:hypothetical protein
MEEIQKVLDLGVAEFGFPSISFAAMKDEQVWTGCAGFSNIEKKVKVRVH